MWIKTEGAFIPYDIKDSEWDLMSNEEQEKQVDWLPFRFDTGELAAYNRSSDGQYCTIRLKGGHDQRIKMSVEQLDKHIFKIKTNEK